MGSPGSRPGVEWGHCSLGPRWRSEWLVPLHAQHMRPGPFDRARGSEYKVALYISSLPHIRMTCVPDQPEQAAPLSELRGYGVKSKPRPNPLVAAS
ncbi:hypothetical protein HZ326_18089 [Fusarium oxysporum f. sp. albedinis]|nr:hypothetical protein HZ326_18089 [Fusarium oxysporum f. sp. albedinis]